MEIRQDGGVLQVYQRPVKKSWRKEQEFEDELREAIIAGKRKRNLRNISIKIDPLYLQSIKKIATMKGIPYQTLVREWLAEKIRKELKIA